MNIEECFEKELLRKDAPDAEKAERSIIVAEEKIHRANELIYVRMYEEALVAAYTAMFHAGRALLFRDGVKERSHYALYIYIKEKYGDEIEPRFINELNTLRMERHDAFYSLEPGEEVKEVEAEHAIKTSTEFLQVIKKIVGENKN